MKKCLHCVIMLGLLSVLLLISLSSVSFAYLDPGTGSYLFQIFIALFVGAAFTAKIWLRKIKSVFCNFFLKKDDQRKDDDK